MNNFCNDIWLDDALAVNDVILQRGNGVFKRLFKEKVPGDSLPPKM